MMTRKPDEIEHDASDKRRDDYHCEIPPIPIIIGTGQAIPTFGAGQVMASKRIIDSTKNVLNLAMIINKTNDLAYLYLEP